MGNIAFAGRIPERLMDEELTAGYAVAGTDDGHQTSSVYDASWAMGHPEQVVDYGFRALVETTRAAKSLHSFQYSQRGPPMPSQSEICID